MRREQLLPEAIRTLRASTATITKLLRLLEERDAEIVVLKSKIGVLEFALAMPERMRALPPATNRIQ